MRRRHAGRLHARGDSEGASWIARLDEIERLAYAPAFAYELLIQPSRAADIEAATPPDQERR